MANLTNTTISGTGHITPPASNTFLRTPELITTIVRWTTSGFTVLRGNTPTASSSSWTAPTGVNYVEVLAVGGGGGGSNDHGGGGGGGGVVYNANFAVTPGTSYAISVANGGTGGPALRGTSSGLGTNGGNTTFSTITAYGGGYGGSYSNGGAAAGASGGGAGGNGGTGGAALGYGQGYPGGSNFTGNAPDYIGAGGGGAGGPGGNVGPTATFGGGGGGVGRAFDISGTLTYYGGGGGGCCAYQSNTQFGAGGLGGGGRGATSSATAASGTAATGGGGGGANRYEAGGGVHVAGTIGTAGAGGSGVVILRYQQTAAGTDIRGSLRYNTDLTGLEVYENHMTQWKAQDESKNFAGHNLLTNSNLRGNDLGVEAIWTKTNNSTDVAAPDGSTTTTKCVSGTSGNSFFWQTGSITYKTSTTYTESVWVRVASGTGSILFNNGVNATQTITPTTTFQRFSFTYTTTSSAGPVYYLGFSSPSLSTTFYFWGWQLEEGVTSPGPYVVTSTAPSPAPGIVGNYRIHQYTTTGISGFTPAVSGNVEVLVVAGGGGGGSSIYGQGGAGAGGVIHDRHYPVIAGKPYSVAVGAGGTPSTNGSPSWFGSIYAGGGGHSNPGHPGGGGAVGQGFQGGYHVYSSPYPCGGGGGAGGKGMDANTGQGPGAGGPGISCDITGTPVFYGGGGGATQYNAAGEAAGGIGGGGRGVYAGTGVSGTANTGGGGGAGGGNGVGGSGGSGGSGVVIVRYRYN